MKLYATTTSERASKGQGGNKQLVIDIQGEKLEGIPTRQNLFKLVLDVEDNKLTATIWDYTEGNEILLYPRHCSTPPTKGEKQKDEICRHHVTKRTCYTCGQ